METNWKVGDRAFCHCTITGRRNGLVEIKAILPQNTTPENMFFYVQAFTDLLDWAPNSPWEATDFTLNPRVIRKAGTHFNAAFSELEYIPPDGPATP